MSQVNKLFVSDEQYHNSGTSSAAWSKRPLIYDHKQLAARKVWNFDHNLGTQPILNVYAEDLEGNLQQLDSSQYTVTLLSDSKAIIAFGTALTGTVQCLVRQSANKVVYSTTEATAAPVKTRLLYNQTIVLASKVANISTLTLVVNSSPQKVVTLSTDPSALAKTPWVDIQYVTINNERYKLFSIDASSLSAGESTTASFWFSLVSGAVPVRGETYVLLAKEPYAHSVDKLLSSVVDISVVNPTFQSFTSLVANTLYCDPKLVASVYPPMELSE
jgi:hypothetical protein